MPQSRLDIIKLLLEQQPQLNISCPLDSPSLVCEEKSLLGSKNTFRVVEAKDFKPATSPDDNIQVIWRIHDNKDDIPSPESSDPAVQDMTFLELRNRLLDLDTIVIRLKSLCQKSYTDEGWDYYIKPNAVSESKKCSTSLHGILEAYHSSTTGHGGLINLMGGYGDGKTTALRHFIYDTAIDDNDGKDKSKHNDTTKKLESLPCIPLLFNLNEQHVDNIQGFIERVLLDDYGLRFSFETFTKLVQHGIFSVFFDALDQMYSQPIDWKITKDYLLIRELAKGSGKVFLACRLYFHRRYLQAIEDGGNHGENPPGQNSSVLDTLRLMGFSQEELEAYIDKRSQENPEIKDKSSLDAFTAFVNKHQRKPLLVKIIFDHIDEFCNLAEAREEEGKDIADFDVFNLPYQAWLEQGMAVFAEEENKKILFNLPCQDWLEQGMAVLAEEEIKRILRSIVRNVTDQGINSTVPFDRWLEMYSQEGGTTPASSDDQKKLRKALEQLDFLDKDQLKNAPHRLSFPYPPFLEFLVARFVVDELHEEPTFRSLSFGKATTKYAILREVCLTPPARHMALSQLDASKDGPELVRRIEASREKTFATVQFEASNCASLLFQATWLGLAGGWRKLAAITNFTNTVLCQADFSKADLSHVDFTQADLSNAVFSFCRLAGTRFEAANLEGALFEEHGNILTSCIVYHGTKQDLVFIGGTRSGLVYAWSLNDYKPIHTFRPHRDEVTALKVSGDQVITGSKDGFIAKTPLDPRQPPQLDNPDLKGIRALAVQGDVYAGGESGNAVRLNIASLQPKRLYTAGLGENDSPFLTALDVTEQGHVLLGHADGIIRLLRPDGEEMDIQVIGSTDNGSQVTSINVVNNNNALANDEAGQIYRISLSDQNAPELIRLGTQGKAIAVARESKQVFFLHENTFSFGPLEVAMQNPQELPHVTCQPSRTLAVSPDGRYVAVGGSTLEVLDGNKYFDPVLKTDMYLDCNGMNINYSKGLTPDQVVFLLGRNTQLPPDSFLAHFIDLEATPINRRDRTYRCDGKDIKLSPTTVLQDRKLTETAN